MSPTLLNTTGPIWAAAAVVAGAAIDNDSDIIDMAEYEGVVFMTTIEDSVDTAVAAMAVEANDADSGVGMAVLAGALATLTCAADDDLNGKILAVDVYRPAQRYLRVKRTSDVANIAFGSVVAIRYGARKLPVDDAAAGAMTSVTSPQGA